MVLDNPLYSFDHADGEAGNRRKVPVPVSMRESPAIWMHGHGKINDSQLRAAGQFRRWYEAAGGAGVKAMDTTKEPVDGGRVSDGLTDRKLHAAKELAGARTRLSPRAYWLVESVCGQCIWIKDLDGRRRTQDAYSMALKEALDSLAIFWGYASENQQKAAS
jgi:hypothetical protein